LANTSEPSELLENASDAPELLHMVSDAAECQQNFSTVWNLVGNIPRINYVFVSIRFSLKMNNHFELYQVISKMAISSRNAQTHPKQTYILLFHYPIHTRTKKPMDNTFCCQLHPSLNLYKITQKSWFVGVQPATPSFILYSKRAKQIQIKSTSKPWKQFEHQTAYKNFLTLFHKVRLWNLEQTLTGKQKIPTVTPANKSYACVSWCVIACKNLMIDTTCHITGDLAVPSDMLVDISPAKKSAAKIYLTNNNHDYPHTSNHTTASMVSSRWSSRGGKQIEQVHVAAKFLWL
jgi:hypothetical protein